VKRYAALVALAALLAGCSDAGADEAAAGPEPLPAVTVKGFDGGPSLDLGSVKGPAVLNFWASWCGPCRDELPVLQSFHEANPDVTVIGIDYQDPQADKAVDLAARSGLTYDLYTDLGGDLAGQGPFPSMRGLPYTALVDSQGRVVHGEYVEIKTVDQLERLVEQHLGADA